MQINVSPVTVTAFKWLCPGVLPEVSGQLVASCKTPLAALPRTPVWFLTCRTQAHGDPSSNFGHKHKKECNFSFFVSLGSDWSAVHCCYSNTFKSITPGPGADRPPRLGFHRTRWITGAVLMQSKDSKNRIVHTVKKQKKQTTNTQMTIQKPSLSLSDPCPSSHSAFPMAKLNLF